MGTAPQPPRAPVAPPPPRTGSHLVAIVLLVLALIIVVCGITLYTGVHFLSHNVQLQMEKGPEGSKDVSIKTPVGDFEVHKDSNVTEARLGLPIYPGGQPMGNDFTGIVSMQFPGEQMVNVRVAKFKTPDAVELVEKFYQDRIGKNVTKFTERNSEGKTVFEIKREGEEKVVALKGLLTGTEIELVRVLHGEKQVN